MIEIFGEIYYIDFEVLDLFLTSDPNFKRGEIVETQTKQIEDDKGNLITKEITTVEGVKPREINGVRFELIRGFIDDISGVSEEPKDAKLGDKLEEQSVGFKLAFNTLTAYQILKPIED